MGRQSVQRTHDRDPQGGTARGGGTGRGQTTGAAAHRGNPPPSEWSATPVNPAGRTRTGSGLAGRRGGQTGRVAAESPPGGARGGVVHDGTPLPQNRSWRAAEAAARDPRVGVRVGRPVDEAASKQV